MDKDKLKEIKDRTEDLLYSVNAGSESGLRGDAERSVDDLKALIAEVERLQGKIRSGVGVAHEIQKDYFEGNSIDTHHLSSMDDAAYLILAAMGEPRYMTA